MTLVGSDAGGREHRAHLRNAARLGTTAVVAALGAIAAVMLAGAALGYERYVITGGSMAGTYDRGSLLFSQRVPVDELEPGDVITYEPPADAQVEGLVTHRIVSVQHRPQQGTTYRTAGDANAGPDPWRFELPGGEQARARFAIPYIGYAFAALGQRAVRIAVIGLPALLIALSLLARLWREAGEEAERSRAVARLAQGD